MANTKLRIVIFQEGEWLCAHCLEYDFATQAKIPTPEIRVAPLAA